MLIVFTRAIIIYVFLLIVMRLMGKKQLGELQPFEFAITLIVADLACIPMGDTSMPITYGLVPIFTLFVIHLLVTKLTKHSIKLRKLINGKPIIVINGDGIDYEMMKSLDMTVNDLMEALRSNGFFSPDEVEFAIVETNGDLSVLPKTENIPLTRGDRVLEKRRDKRRQYRFHYPLYVDSGRQAYGRKHRKMRHRRERHHRYSQQVFAKAERRASFDRKE